MADPKGSLADTSLQRVQEFDVSSLPREQELGQALNFQEAVEPARRVISLFRQFPRQFLDDLPDNRKKQIASAADGFFNLLNEILKFDPKEANSYERKNTLIQNIRNQYQSLFDQLHELISYGASRQRDFSAIEQDFRASIQRSEDAAVELRKKLEKQEEEGRTILEETRKIAAEQGVSQQARYFKDDSEQHKSDSEIWKKYTIRTAIALAVYAFLTMFLHKIPGLTPSSTYDSFQLAISKILIFAVLGYVVLLCARNFLSHKHNEIVNKHRQNALLTFKALVDAGGTQERRDVVLTYAAACIFSPQDTGYSKSSDVKGDIPISVMQALPKLAGGDK